MARAGDLDWVLYRVATHTNTLSGWPLPTSSSIAVIVTAAHLRRLSWLRWGVLVTGPVTKPFNPEQQDGRSVGLPNDLSETDAR